MKFSLSNLLAVASILVWATAWAATEKNAALAKSTVTSKVRTSNAERFSKKPFAENNQALAGVRIKEELEKDARLAVSEASKNKN